jgi:L-lactate dehydrogenase complex protein LldF
MKNRLSRPDNPVKPVTRNFRDKAAETIADPRLQSALENVYTGFFKARIAASDATDNWEEMRTRGKAIKDHTIANLDHYLDMLATNVERKGGHAFFAKDSEEANRYVLDLAEESSARTVIKSKSMVSEEMGLNHSLTAAGVETVETDLGEYIIQLAGETPYHLIAPAIHKSKEQVSELLAERSADLGGSDRREEDTKALTMQARAQLREVFQRADMSITGVNFGVAESGGIALVTNEGNGRMATSAPRIHVAVMGMEKVIPSIRDLATMLRILIRSATGQRISSYVTLVNGPRRNDEEDGPDEFHLIIMDNGRSKLLADEALRESLNCIRCGACLNACPVYRKVGGHSYGWVYPGPIGAIVSPVLTGLKDGKDLPFASSLCGACHDACPVKINIPRMLLELRGQVTEGDDPSQKSRGRWETLLWKGWKWGMMDRKRFDRGARLGRAIGGPFASDGWLRRSIPPLTGWTSSRDFPLPAKESFITLFKARKLDERVEERQPDDAAGAGGEDNGGGRDG